MLDIRTMHNVRTLGTGDSTLVMAHGFGCTQHVWRRVMPRFTGRYRVVLFDLMGCNVRSAPFFDALKYRQLHAYARDLVAVLEEVGGAPVQYVGHSVSGMIGALAAIERPELFARLILLNPSPCYLHKDGYEGGFTEADVQAMLDAVMRGYKEWAESFAPRIVAQAQGEPAVEEFAEGIHAMRPDIALSMLLAIFTSDLRDALPSLRTPTVIVQTTRDPAVPMSVSRYMCGRIPDCRVETIDLAGHLPHLTDPDMVADALERHLD